MKHNLSQFTFIVILSLFFSFTLLAQVPQLLNYQGVLIDPGSGERLSGTYTMTFSIYAEETGGIALWTETQNVIAQNGLFNVLLGSVTDIPFDLFDGSARYLGVKVGDDAEMTPRKQLVSVVYAFKSRNTDKFSGLDTSDFVKLGQENSVSTKMIQNAAITNSKIANNAVTISKISPRIVSSIDGVVHDGADIDLVAGDNITIIPDDANNKITISATAGAGDNLGNHTATQNVTMGNHRISRDGGNDGIYFSSNGDVNIGDMIDLNILLGNLSLIRSEMTFYGEDESESYFGYGVSTSSTVSGTEGYIGKQAGVYGKNWEGVDTEGYIASANYGVYGENSGIKGYLGGTYGAYGEFGENYGYLGGISTGVYGKQGSDPGDKAGYFDGDVHVTGTLSKAAGAFLIDHPLDPANKYLAHSFVESPDMKNIYDGVVTLDENGEAVVNLPDWFGALNKDFRYQLTCIGGFAQVYIKQEIQNNSFKIAGGKSNMKVSWLVTGIRKDPYANAHRVQVEQEKQGSKKGKYLHPTEYGFPQSMGIDFEQQMQIEKEKRQMEENKKKVRSGMKNLRSDK